MATQDVTLRLLADVTKLKTGLSGAGSSVRQLSSRIEELTAGTLKLTKAGRFYDTESKKFVSNWEAQRRIAGGLKKEYAAQATAIRNVANATKATIEEQQKQINASKSLAQQSRETTAQYAASGNAVQQLTARLVGLTKGQYLLSASGEVLNAETMETATLQNVAAAATDRLAREQNELRLAYEQATSGMDAAQRQMLGQQMAMSGMAHATGSASFAVLSLGQGFQDAGQFGMGMAQGIRAVTNNAQQAFQAFVLLQQQTRGTTNAFRAMWSAMMGPAGLLLAFGAITAAIEFYANRSQRAGKDTKSLTDSVNELTKAASPKGFEAGSRGLDMVADAAARVRDNYQRARDAAAQAMQAASEAARQAAREQGRPTTPAAARAASIIIDEQRESNALLDEQIAFWAGLTEKKREEAEESAKLEKAYRSLIAEMGVDGVVGAIREQAGAAEETKRIIARAELVARAGFGTESEFNKGLEEARSRLVRLGIGVALTEEKFADIMEDGNLDAFIRGLRVDRLLEFTAAAKDAQRELEGIRLEFMALDGTTSIADRFEEIRRSTTLVGRMQGAQGIGEGMVGELRVFSDSAKEEMRLLGEEIENQNRNINASFRGWWNNNKDAVLTSAQIMSQSIGTIGTSFMQIAKTGDSQNKRLFETGKKFAIAQALISTYVGFTKALEQGGPLGLVTGAGVLAAGMAKVAAIRATKMGGGASGASGSAGISSAPTFFTGFGNVSDVPSSSLSRPATPISQQAINIQLVAQGSDLVGVLSNESDLRARAVGAGTMIGTGGSGRAFRDLGGAVM